ncbi:d-importin 7/ranbp7 [Anaeramoeba flamelloides]|uniref:D-importin 7/ranbp7 n=1 Tax=Anaeramoeba flamelloides TaxID=1746091 RepID=A0AAV7Z1Y4_9EUKA|nr:d-importin 7/ranbp7 [Anaeramoeba flamelloides]
MGYPFEKIFNGTLSINRSVQIQSEEELLLREKEKNFFQSLFDFMLIEENGLEVRQAASIYLKNRIRSGWREQKKKQSIFDEEAKHYILSNFLKALLIAVPLIRSQLTESLLYIFYSEFPKGLPDLVEETFQFLTSQNIDKIFTALIVIKTIGKRFKFLNGEQNKCWLDIFHLVLPEILVILKELLQEQNNSSNEQDLISSNCSYLISKIVWFSSQLDLPYSFLDDDLFSTLIDLFLGILSRPLSEEYVSLDIHEIETTKWIKTKRRILHFFIKMVYKYGTPSQVKEKHIKFSSQFQSVSGKEILSSVLKLLANYSKENDNLNCKSQRILQLQLIYLEYSLKNEKLNSLVVQSYEWLLPEILLPVLKFNEDDQYFWENEPSQYLLQEEQEEDTTWAIRPAAKSLIKTMVDPAYDPDSNLITFTLQIISENFEGSSKNSDEGESILNKDGALSLLGIISDELLNSKFDEELETVVVEHIFPEFESKYGFIRARCCWLLSKFADIPWKDENNLKMAIKFLFHSLEDEELPVRSHSGASLQYYLKYFKNDFQQIEENLTQIITSLLDLINLVGLPDHVSSLSKLIKYAQGSIIPHAITLTKMLLETFTNAIINDKDNLETEYHYSSAKASLKTIETIMEALDQQEAILEICKILFPFLSTYMVMENAEYIEHFLRLINTITYCLEDYPIEVIELLENIYVSFNKYAADCFSSIIEPLSHYLEKAQSALIELDNGKYMGILISFCKDAISENAFNEETNLEGCKLCHLIIQYFNGKIDSHIPTFLQIAIKRITTFPEYVPLQVLLHGIIANCYYYNPLLTLTILEAPTNEKISEKMGTQALQSGESAVLLFSNWFELIRFNKLRSSQSKKVAILALASIFSLDLGKLPNLLLEFLPEIFNCLIWLLHFYRNPDAYLLDLNEDEEAKFEYENDLANEEFTLDSPIKPIKHEKYVKNVFLSAKENNLEFIQELENLLEEGNKSFWDSIVNNN